MFTTRICSCSFKNFAQSMFSSPPTMWTQLNIQEEELLGKQVKIIILRTKKWPNLEYGWYVFQQFGCKNKPESRQYNCYSSNWWYKVEFSVPVRATGLEMTIILRSEQKNDFIWNVQTICKYTTEHKNVSGYFLFRRFCLFQRFC